MAAEETADVVVSIEEAVAAATTAVVAMVEVTVAAATAVTETPTISNR